MRKQATGERIKMCSTMGLLNVSSRGGEVVGEQLERCDVLVVQVAGNSRSKVQLARFALLVLGMRSLLGVFFPWGNLSPVPRKKCIISVHENAILEV